jgi:ankyrin repeat protein
MEATTTRSSPLIEAIQRRKPLHVIQRIVEVDPDSVSRQVDDNDNDNDDNDDNDNWYPLHEAVVARAPVDVVRFLAIRYPQALRAKDKMGWLPLHFAVQNPKPPNSLDVIRRPGSEWPDALRELTNGGWDAEQISIQLGNWEAALILDELWFERGAERNVDDGAILDGPWFGRGPTSRQQHQMPPAPPPQLPSPPFRRRKGPRSAMPWAKSSNCSRRRSQPS